MKNCGLRCIEYFCNKNNIMYYSINKYTNQSILSMYELLEVLHVLGIEANGYKVHHLNIKKPYILHLKYKNWQHYILVLFENNICYYIFDGSSRVYYIPKLLIQSLSTNRVITLNKQ